MSFGISVPPDTSDGVPSQVIHADRGRFGVRVTSFQARNAEDLDDPILDAARYDGVPDLELRIRFHTITSGGSSGGRIVTSPAPVRSTRLLRITT